MPLPNSTGVCTPEFLAVAVVSEPLPSDHYLLRSAAMHGYNLHLQYMKRQNFGDFVTQRFHAMLAFLRRQCADSVILFVDAYDVFFNAPAARAIQRFRSSGADIVWSVERFFSGQDEGDHAFFEAMRQRHGNLTGTRPLYGFINTGGFIGIASQLTSLISEALMIRPGAHGWRNKTCGEPVGRRCADQWVFGHLLAAKWNHYRVKLDYDRSIFYVATSHDWAFSLASSRIRETSPCAVHMPFIVAPRVNATLYALWKTFGLHEPPPESNATQCAARSHHCKEAGYGFSALAELLEKNTTSSTAIKRKHLGELSCQTGGRHNRWSKAQMSRCELARAQLQAAPEAVRATVYNWKNRTGAKNLMLEALLNKLPYCYRFPDGRWSTWVTCR
jgi:hypothetical protein